MCAVIVVIAPASIAAFRVSVFAVTAMYWLDAVHDVVKYLFNSACQFLVCGFENKIIFFLDVSVLVLYVLRTTVP